MVKKKFFFLFLFLLNSPLFQVQANGPVMNIVVQQFPPWEIVESEKRQDVSTGIAINLLKKIALKLHFKIKLETVPWKRALNYIKLGKADLVPMILKTSDRNEYMEFTNPLYTDHLVLIYNHNKSPSFKFTHFKNLKGLTIGTIQGAAYGEAWKKAKIKYNLLIEATVEDKTNLLKVENGRLDLALGLYSYFLYNQEKHKNLSVTKRSVEKIPFRFGISKKSKFLKKIKEINKALEDLKADGSYKVIFEKFQKGLWNSPFK